MDKLYALFVRASSSLASPFLLVVRVYWGWQFHTTGAGKLHNIGRVVDFFTSLGIPAPAANAWFISGLEFIGGLLLILGLASRPVALLFVADMIVAYVAADRQALGSIFSDPGKFYNADPFTFLFAAFIVLLFGPGRLSLDALIASRRGCRTY